MKIVGPDTKRPIEIEGILRTLPMWFGIEKSLLMYVADSATKPTFAAEAEDGNLVAFLTLTQHFPTTWEVHCMAVSASHRNTGLGSALLEHTEQFLRSNGARFLQVKTVAESAPSAGYAQTRKFYLAKGFTPLEVFPTLWDPRNPALQLVKALNEA
jgi:GNAT superfamily N-acetyltransferase